MLDDLNKRPNGDGQRETPTRGSSHNPPMADREVPIVASTPFEAMHRWLDGDGSEAEALADPESARYVALWRRMGEETARRRRATRPSADLTDRIMAALPAAAPQSTRADRVVSSAAAATVTSAPALPAVAAPAIALPMAAPRVAPAAATWWQRPIALTPMTALAVGVGLLALGLLLGSALRGQ